MSKNQKSDRESARKTELAGKVQINSVEAQAWLDILEPDLVFSLSSDGERFVQGFLRLTVDGHDVILSTKKELDIYRFMTTSYQEFTVKVACTKIEELDTGVFVLAGALCRLVRVSEAQNELVGLVLIPDFLLPCIDKDELRPVIKPEQIFTVEGTKLVDVTKIPVATALEVIMKNQAQLEAKMAVHWEARDLPQTG